MNAGTSKHGTGLWMKLLSVALISGAAAACGCSQGSRVASGDPQANGKSAEIKAHLAQLSEQDRKLAEAKVSAS